MKFAKLIAETSGLCTIKGKLTEEELIDIYLNPTTQSILKKLAEYIVQAKLTKPHYYRLSIQLHAQEIEKEKKDV